MLSQCYFLATGRCKKVISLCHADALITRTPSETGDYAMGSRAVFSVGQFEAYMHHLDRQAVV